MSRSWLAALLLGALWASSPARAQDAAPPAARAASREAAGDAAGAADAWLEALEAGDPALQVVAATGLARNLRDLGRDHAALAAAVRGLRAAPEEPPADLVRLALELADATGDHAALEDVFAEKVPVELDEVTRSRAAWLAAQGNIRRDNLAVTLAILPLIAPDTPWFARAMHLKGVVLAQQGRTAEALAAFATAAAKGADDPELVELVTLNQARAFYAAGNFVRAIESYARIPRSSPHWLEAQFERAWAHFRLEDMNGTIGLLQTFVSPWFARFYAPEAWMLRTYALFLVCKFPEASEQVERFEARYRPLVDAVLPRVAGMRPAELVEQVRLLRDGGNPALPLELLRPYRDERRIQDTLLVLDGIAGERARPAEAGYRFPEVVDGWLAARSRTLTDQEGARIQSEILQRLHRLEGMLGDAQVAKLDLLRLQTRLYEAASATGALPENRQLAVRSVRARAHQHVWPYEGEWWADELGWYRAALRTECPAGLQAGSAN